MYIYTYIYIYNFDTFFVMVILILFSRLFRQVEDGNALTFSISDGISRTACLPCQIADTQATIIDKITISFDHIIL